MGSINNMNEFEWIETKHILNNFRKAFKFLSLIGVMLMGVAPLFSKLDVGLKLCMFGFWLFVVCVALESLRKKRENDLFKKGESNEGVTFK